MVIYLAAFMVKEWQGDPVDFLQGFASDPL